MVWVKLKPAWEAPSPAGPGLVSPFKLEAAGAAGLGVPDMISSEINKKFQHKKYALHAPFPNALETDIVALYFTRYFQPQSGWYNLVFFLDY